MKRARGAALVATFITTAVALLLVSGCGGGGGKTTQDVRSPWYGQLYGIAVEPGDQETNIALDSWIHVFWPNSGYAPPASFTVRLEKEQSPNDWGAVHTVQSNTSNPAGGSWWFQPESNFSPDTWYRIIVTDDRNRQAIAYFHTTATTLSRGAQALTIAGAGQRYRPTGAENAPAATGGVDEQVIRR